MTKSKVCELGDHAACMWLLCACPCHGPLPLALPVQLYEDDGNATCVKCRRSFGQHILRDTIAYPNGVACCP